MDMVYLFSIKTGNESLLLVKYIHRQDSDCDCEVENFETWNFSINCK